MKAGSINIKEAYFWNKKLSRYNAFVGTVPLIDAEGIEVVDLGLSSGTLWAKYNLEASGGNSKEDWYGKYLMWGELEGKAGWEEQGTKVPYDWANYKHANGDSHKLTKYCHNPRFGNDGYIDDLKVLVPMDDAATQTDSTLKIPTKENFDELINLQSQWIKNYDPSKAIHNFDDDEGVSGLNGRLFVGNNGNTLFIPAAGYRSGSRLSAEGSFCGIWSSTLASPDNDPELAYILSFNQQTISSNNYVNRCYGYPIRPIKQI